MARTPFNRKRSLTTTNKMIQKLFRGFENKLIKCYTRSIAIYGSSISMPRKMEERCMESVLMWKDIEIEVNGYGDK